MSAKIKFSRGNLYCIKPDEELGEYRYFLYIKSKGKRCWCVELIFDGDDFSPQKPTLIDKSVLSVPKKIPEQFKF